MQVKFKALVAAVALVAGGAQAAITSPTTTNTAGGELFLRALDASLDTPQALFIDLGVQVGNFLPTSSVNAPGTKIVWDFANNTTTTFLNGVQQSTPFVSGTNSWSSAFSAFKAAATTANTQWVVAGAQAPTTGTKRFVVTGNPDQSNIDSYTASAAASYSNLTNWESNYANVGSVGALTGTASTGAASNGAGVNVGDTAPMPTGFANWTVYTANGAASHLSYVQPTVTRPGSLATITEFGSNIAANTAPADALYSTFTFDLATNQLVWQAATPTAVVPEPESIALLIGGLAVVGFVARRRA